jgi:hypothetical protein
MPATFVRDYCGPTTRPATGAIGHRSSAPLSELRQHSRDEIALLERAGALEALAPPTIDRVEEPGGPPKVRTLVSMPMPTTNPATQAREALDRFRKFQQGLPISGT